MNWNVFLLALSQAVVMTTVSLALSTSAIVGARLSSPDLATLPLALQYLGTVLVLYPIARLMEYYGRRLIFISGALIGLMALGLAAAGIKYNDFTLFTIGSLFVGIFNAVGQYYRFAAAEAVSSDRQSLAVSLTLTGGLLAAILGPTLARWTKDILDPPFYASFLALIGITFVAVTTAILLKLPSLVKVTHHERPNTLREIIKDSKLIVAIISGITAYSIMNLLMTATPLAMMCSNFSFNQTASVIQWHIVAMFAPSFLTGLLIQRVGVLPIMLFGCFLNLASVVVSLGGEDIEYFEFALILLGIGWNFLYVGATTLLIKNCRKGGAFRIQAFNDILVFSGVTLATLFSGTLVNQFGWKMINIYSAIPIIMISILIIWLMRRV